jgi:hypothetical protein
MMNGNKTRNHATGVAPDLQIKFKIQVQKRTYTNLTAKIKYVLDTSHECDPTQ